MQTLPGHSGDPLGRRFSTASLTMDHALRASFEHVATAGVSNLAASRRGSTAAYTVGDARRASNGALNFAADAGVATSRRGSIAEFTAMDARRASHEHLAFADGGGAAPMCTEPLSRRGSIAGFTFADARRASVEHLFHANAEQAAPLHSSAPVLAAGPDTRRRRSLPNISAATSSNGGASQAEGAPWMAVTSLPTSRRGSLATVKESASSLSSVLTRRASTGTDSQSTDTILQHPTHDSQRPRSAEPHTGDGHGETDPADLLAEWRDAFDIWLVEDGRQFLGRENHQITFDFVFTIPPPSLPSASVLGMHSMGAVLRVTETWEFWKSLRDQLPESPQPEDMSCLVIAAMDHWDACDDLAAVLQTKDSHQRIRGDTITESHRDGNRTDGQPVAAAERNYVHATVQRATTLPVLPPMGPSERRPRRPLARARSWQHYRIVGSEEDGGSSARFEESMSTVGRAVMTRGEDIVGPGQASMTPTVTRLLLAAAHLTEAARMLHGTLDHAVPAALSMVQPAGTWTVRLS
jgi:hypothetical protein